MDITPYLALKPAPQVLFDSAAKYGSAPRYFVQQAGAWHPVNWHHHAERVAQVASGLQAIDVQPGDRVAIFAPNSVHWMEAALGTQAARAVMVPIYASNTVEQLAYVVSHSDAVILFVDTAPLLAKVVAGWPLLRDTVRAVVVIDAALADLHGDAHAAPLDGRLLTLDSLCDQGMDWQQRFPQCILGLSQATGLDDPAIMLYTSGTSGNPKGVPLTHRNIGVNGRDWLLCNGPLVEEGDTDLLWLPMSHIFGYGEACLGNTLGFVSYLCEPVQVMARLPQVRPEVLMSVPMIWEKLAQSASRSADPKRGLAELTGGRLRFCLSGGAGLKREVKELFRDCGLLILEGYGLTEAAPTLTLNRPDDYRFDSVGKPLPSVTIRLADDGEILAKGPNVFSGYHKDPEATRAIFDADGWLLTGDVGRWTEDGFLQIIDRKKDILVTAGGKNVPPANIEQQFADEPLIAQVVVYGDAKPFLTAGIWPNVLMMPLLLADVPQQDWPRVVRERIAAKVATVNATLARHETLKQFVVLDRPLSVEGGQLTPTLKVKRKRVCEEFCSEFEAMYAQPPLRTSP